MSAFRIEPAGPVTAYKTYALISPTGTHTRVARCAEVGCEHHAQGWRTTIDVSTELGRRQAAYIRDHSGRTFSDVTGFGSTLVTLLFPPGQQCFREHRVPLEREPLYVVRGGDHRGNPTGERRAHVRGADWVEDFALHQDQIAERVSRG